MDIFKKIKYQNTAAYGVIAALLLAIFVTLWLLVDRQQHMAHLINITGKQ